MKNNKLMPTPIFQVFLIGADLNHLEVIRLYGENRPYFFKLTLIHHETKALLPGFLGSVLAKDIMLDEILVDIGHLCLLCGVELINENIKHVDAKNKKIQTTHQLRDYDLVSISSAWAIDGLTLYHRILESLDKNPHSILFKGESPHSVELVLAIRSQLNPEIEVKFVSSGRNWPAGQQHEIICHLAHAKITLQIKDQHPYTPVNCLDTHQPLWVDSLIEQIPSFCLSKKLSKIGKVGCETPDLILGQGDPSTFSYCRAPFSKICRKDGLALWVKINESLGKSPSFLSRLKLIGIGSFLAKKDHFFSEKKRSFTRLSMRRSMLNLVAKYRCLAKKIRNQTYLESSLCTSHFSNCSALPITIHEFSKMTSTQESHASNLEIISGEGGKCFVQKLEFLSKSQLNLFQTGSFLAKTCNNYFEISGLKPNCYLFNLQLPFESEKMLQTDFGLFSKGVECFFNSDQVLPIQCKVQASDSFGAQLLLQGSADELSLSKLGGYYQNEDGMDIMISRPLGTGLLIEGHRVFMVSSPQLFSSLEQILKKQWQGGMILKEQSIFRKTIVGCEGVAHSLRKLITPLESASIFTDTLPVWPEVMKAIEMKIRLANHSHNKSYFAEELQSLRFGHISKSELLFSPEYAGPWLFLTPKKASKLVLEQLHGSGLNEATIIGEVLPVRPRKNNISFH